MSKTNYKGSLNPRLIEEIQGFNVETSLKDFLKELLLSENADVYGNSSRVDQYKKLIVQKNEKK